MNPTDRDVHQNEGNDEQIEEKKQTKIRITIVFISICES